MQEMYIPPQHDTMSVLDDICLDVDYASEIEPFLGRKLVRLPVSVVARQCPSALVLIWWRAATSTT